MRKRSVVYSISEEEFSLLLKSSSSVTKVIEFFGLRKIGGNYRTLKKVSEEYGLTKEFYDLVERGKKNSGYIYKGKTLIDTYGFTNIFCEGSIIDRTSVKRIILKNNIIEYKCKKCGNEGIWLSEKIVLELEHINGINNDNRLENLCFLCPNCHSQTRTFSGRNNKRPNSLMVE